MLEKRIYNVQNLHTEEISIFFIQKLNILSACKNVYTKMD